MNLFDLSGKNAVVVGAGGLGQAIIKGLIGAGAKVLMADLYEESLKKAQTSIKEELGADTLIFTGNAAKEEDVVKLVAYAVEKMGKVDILVNAQGFNKKQDALDFDIDTFRQMLDANVTSL
jgi:gluconate 5-dehydrogenase